MKSGRGAFIARKSEEDSGSIVNWFIKHEVELSDYMDVRMAIEPLAVKLTVQRADEKEMQELEEIFHKFHRAVENCDSVKLAVYDEAFHLMTVS